MTYIPKRKEAPSGASFLKKSVSASYRYMLTNPSPGMVGQQQPFREASLSAAICNIYL